jgi:hypothetical protein
MKRLLVLAAGASISTLAFIAYAQGVNGVPLNPTPAVASPSPAAGAPDQMSGDASSVPLPAQAVPTASPSGPAIPLMQESTPGSTPGGKSGKGGKDKGGKVNSGKGGRNAHATPTPPKQTFDVEADIRLRVHIREAQTKAVNEPALEAQWAAAHDIKIDPKRRTALIAYYNHLYDTMIKIDPTITTAVNVRRNGVVNRMQYARLGDLLPSEDPYAAPTPAPSGPNPPAEEGPATY